MLQDLLDWLPKPEDEGLDIQPYFLGSIVLIKKGGIPDPEVVDGQQRLTTLTILLSVLRYNLSGRAAANELTSFLYEAGNNIRGTKDRFLLTLRKRDQEFFQKYIQSGSGLGDLLDLEGDLSDSQRRIKENAKALHECVSAMPELERERLARYLVTGCYLVVVATPDIDSAFRIFSVLNSRGLDLSATDILKADILAHLSGSLLDHYTQLWEQVEEDLGRSSFADLFSHVRMIYRKSKPKGTLIKEFKEHVDFCDEPTRLIDDILMPMASAYHKLLDENYVSTQHAEEINESIHWLNRIEWADWVPPALAFMIRNSNQPEKMKGFFGDLERLSYALLICKATINERMDRFSDLIKEIENEEDLSRPESRLQLSTFEQAEVYNRLNGPLYASYNPRARAAILMRLDRLLSDTGATYHYKTISVEHVLPQNPHPDSQWSSWWPDER